MPIHGDAAIWGAFCGDALALGAHWIYDTTLIDAKFGCLNRFRSPLPDTYHPGKKAGDFTHYGDQMLWLLESIAACGKFDLAHFARFWRSRWKTHQGYLDQATKQTLQNMATGRPAAQSGSASDDFSGAARMAPIILTYDGDPEVIMQAAKIQTALTHNHPDVIMAAEWLARLLLQTQHEDLPAAMSAITDAHFHGTPLAQWVEQGLRSSDQKTRQAIAKLGQACSIRGAFPGTVHLLAKYASDIEEALIQNSMAGGDSASRGIAVGMVLGARLGTAHLPTQWLERLSHKNQIDILLTRWRAARENREEHRIKTI